MMALFHVGDVNNYTCGFPYIYILYSYFSSAWDRRSGTQVAIKKLHRPFQSKLFAKRAYRELRLLKHMKHENVRTLSGEMTEMNDIFKKLLIPLKQR